LHSQVAAHYTTGYFGVLARQLGGEWLQAAFTLGERARRFSSLLLVTSHTLRLR